MAEFRSEHDSLQVHLDHPQPDAMLAALQQAGKILNKCRVVPKDEQTTSFTGTDVKLIPIADVPDAENPISMACVRAEVAKAKEIPGTSLVIPGDAPQR